MDNTVLAIVLLIGCFLLGLLIGWLIWGRRLGQVKESLEKAEKTLGERDNEIISLKGQLSTLEAAAAAPDDLTLIEGIGPKIQDLLQSIGIRTFPQLAAANVQKIADMLRGAGLAMANPGSWPQQAKLAAEGAWEALEELQEELKGGRPA
jgi:predicted flap endonuclease-1-like 5' DNA nuclease